jgi:hypothetical protein
MLTKKDFIRLADYLTDESLATYCGMTPERSNLAALREHLANFCRASNPAFKRERWLDYVAGKCGPNGGKR